MRSLLLAVMLAAVALAAPPAVRGAEVSFESTTASGAFGGPHRFETRFRSAEPPLRVELLYRLQGTVTWDVLAAQVSGRGSYEAGASLAGGMLPNSTIVYRFRVVTASGAFEGPQARLEIRDDRFRWRRLQGDLVRLHWYEGSEAFARRALEVGEDALRRIGGVLGVPAGQPVDFFIYADAEAFQEALGPVAREYVAGLAIPETRTLFARLTPDQIDSDWVDEVVAHELAHVVIDGAIQPHRRIPHWLSEGLAVYLSVGFSDRWRAELRDGIRSGRVLPLAGLARKFPPGEERFGLGYGAGASAVDFFVRRHGEAKLVQLVRSYAEGITDDEAFLGATGQDFAAFDQAWQKEIGVGPLASFGPQPAVAGPRPPGWEGVVGGTPAPARTGDPTPPGRSGGRGAEPVLLALLGALAGAGLLALLVVARRPRAAPPRWPDRPPDA
ncbi:MAG TPA: peptidase MA family metallohydrolase [Candidatus Limnocylindrales bacterium]|nr:peptidase MA family metallohydrolase [Candidatus Limnocylindrales bacterium]